MSLTDILHFCETERDWVVETTTALAREESPTQDKAAVDRCGAELARRLEAIGATVETIAREEVGNLLRATVGDGESQLLVLGHFDTVWPVGQIKRMPIRSEAGRLHGPGVYDMKAGIAAQALPNFIMGPILILTFTLWLGLLPGGGWNGGQWEYLIMPVIALSTSYMGSIARITRSSMLEVMNANFIRTARAKGLPQRSIIWRHAMKPTLLPVVSYLGPVFVYVLTGSVFVDLYFSTGGLGQAYVNSALTRDYAVLLGVTILYGALTVIVNLLTDLAYAWFDPKIRY